MQQATGDRCPIASDDARRSVLGSHLGGWIDQRLFELGHASKPPDFSEVRTESRTVSLNLMTRQALTAALENSLAAGGIASCRRLRSRRRHRPEISDD